jgi:hypothetical protein
MREAQAIAANFDLILTSIRKSSATAADGAARLSVEGETAALKAHEEAHEAYLQTMSGCDE